MSMTQKMYDIEQQRKKELEDAVVIAPPSNELLCSKCNKKTTPILAIEEAVPSWAIDIDEEDPDFEDQPEVRAIGSVRMGMIICRNCYYIADTWIESTDTKFRPDWGEERNNGYQITTPYTGME